MNPTFLAPALLNVDSVTSVMMVVDPIPVAPTTVTTSGSLCQDNHHFDPCIDLLGGEILSAQPHLLSADQVPKKFHPLDSNHQALTDPQCHVRAQSTSTQILLASNSQVTFQLPARLQSSNQVLPAGNSQEVFLLLNDGIPASNVPIDDILNCCTYAVQQDLMEPWPPTLPT